MTKETPTLELYHLFLTICFWVASVIQALAAKNGYDNEQSSNPIRQWKRNGPLCYILTYFFIRANMEMTVQLSVMDSRPSVPVAIIKWK